MPRTNRQPLKRIKESLYPQFGSIFWSIASTECGEIPCSANPAISGDATVSICTPTKNRNPVPVSTFVVVQWRTFSRRVQREC
jgi:hypothetical protein